MSSHVSMLAELDGRMLASLTSRCLSLSAGTDDASIKQRVDWYKAFKLVWNIDPGQKCMITATDQHDNVLQIRTRAYKYRAHMGKAT